MDDRTVLARGMGYVPGIARGILQRGAAAPGIALIDQDQIGALLRPPAGILVRDGAPFSHATIALLGLGVPAVILRREDAAALRDGMEVVIDGSDGSIAAAAGARVDRPPPAPRAGVGVATPDGAVVELRASVRSVAAAHKALSMGAAAIGLVRTEFFEPPAAKAPDAGYYTAEFDALCAAAAPLPVTFRLLDVAADKRPAWLPPRPGTAGPLGLQGVRLFGEAAVAQAVRAQLAAIRGLSGRCRARVLLPYLVRHEELRHWIAWTRVQLPEDVAVGAMVETPAGALDLDRWFDLADFIGVGCNDLMQCLFAADRDRPELRAYLDPYAPLLYRFFRTMARQAGTHLADIQLCGVLPQLRSVLPILLGLGYRLFSVDPVHIPYLAQVVRHTTREVAEALADAVCAARDSADVLNLLHIPSARYRPYVAGEGLQT